MDARQANFEQIKIFQKLATRWILGTDKGCYKGLMQLKILPLSLYIEIHSVLMLLAMLQNIYEIEILKAKQIAANVTRHFQRGELAIAKTRLQ